MNWLQSMLYGFLSGVAEVLPISSRAHGILLLKIFGASGNSNLMLLMLPACGAACIQPHPSDQDPSGPGPGPDPQEKTPPSPGFEKPHGF